MRTQTMTHQRTHARTHAPHIGKVCECVCVFVFGALMDTVGDTEALFPPHFGWVQVGCRS